MTSKHTSLVFGLCALAALSPACKRSQPDPPRPPAPHVEPPPVAETPAAPVALTDAGANAPGDAGAQPLVMLRLRNASNVPLTFTTNPDLNEMVHAWRLNVAADRSDRGLVYLNDPAQITRVKLFPVDLPRCDSAAGAGFGGLGSTGTYVLAPGETRDLGTWDGLHREEVIDPQRGACLRETAAPPGRYRIQFDQPKQTRHECARVILHNPEAPGDAGGMPVLEFRCVPRPDGSVDEEE